MPEFVRKQGKGQGRCRLRGRGRSRDDDEAGMPTDIQLNVIIVQQGLPYINDCNTDALNMTAGTRLSLAIRSLWVHGKPSAPSLNVRPGDSSCQVYGRTAPNTTVSRFR